MLDEATVILSRTTKYEMLAMANSNVTSWKRQIKSSVIERCSAQAMNYWTHSHGEVNNSWEILADVMHLSGDIVGLVP